MPELNREDIIKALECCSNWNPKTACKGCPYESEVTCRNLKKDALTLIKQLIEENESLGIENEVQRLNLGNTRDDLNNAECDVARLKRENTALEREVERLKADVVPRGKYENLEREFKALDIECERLEKVEENFHKAKQDVAREIFAEIENARERWKSVYIRDHYGYGGDAFGYLETDVDHALYELKKKYIGENNG